MNQLCTLCQTTFTVHPEDLAFYDKVSPIIGGRKFPIPPPKHCPTCRRQRRLAFRNERRLYNGRCALCAKETISVYSPRLRQGLGGQADKPFPVYCKQCWWSDRYDPFVAGKNYDFARTFTEQFQEVQNRVPHIALNVAECENSDYVNQCGYSKNCYLSFHTDYSQDCYYCTNTIRSQTSLDLLNAEQCELCFQSVDVNGCYMVVGSRGCQNCNNLFFCNHCASCSDCFGCTNLRNAQYCFFNRQYTKEQYREQLSKIMLAYRSVYARGQQRSRDEWLLHPFRSLLQTQCENVTGDNLRNCKNALDCFDCFDNEDTRYCTVTSDLRDSYDFDVGGYGSELCYENVGGGDQLYHCLFSPNLWGLCQEVLYSSISRSGRYLFGCFGVRTSEYCILNKRYTKDEYETLVPKIIEHMISTGEWGEFFHPSLAPFGYNETIAMEHMPLSREEALSKGFLWCDYEPPRPQTEKIAQPSQIPDSIFQIPKSILSWAIECEVTKKPYRIIKQEFNFYREHALPLPTRHPDQRHLDRLALRNPKTLFSRACMNCSAPISTTFAPDRPERVYCERCYLQAVY